LRDDRLRGAIEKLNALVGLLDERGLLLNIGILRTVCQREGYMKILTAFEKEPFAVEFGSVKIDNEGRELPLE
jgi:polynucleotide 5'-kinase involved in rRNA processing